MSPKTQQKKKRGWGKLVALAALVGAIALAVFYATCGHGFGLGGGRGAGLSPGSGPSSAKEAASAPSDAARARCDLRVDAQGIHLAGATVDEAGAVEACKKAGGADVLVTGDAVEGTWAHLRAALDAAGVPAYVRAAIPPVDAGA